MEFKELQTGGLTLSDLDMGEPVGTSLGKRTATQQAATNALLSGKGVEGFREDISTILNPESRQAFMQEQKSLRDGLWNQAKGSLVNIVSDPLIPDEQKQAAFNLSYEDFAKQQSTMKALAEASLMADSGDEETPSSSESRMTTLDKVNEFIAYKRDAQARLNEIRMERSQGLAAKGVDFGELLMPFAEWIHYDHLQRDLTGGEANWSLMGNQKQAIYDHLKTLPISERAAAIQNIIDIIDNNEDVFLPDGNDLLVLDDLEKMLGDGDYSNFERWFDNITSVLEIVGVGSVARTAIKGPKIGAKLAKEAEAFKAAELPTDAKLAEEAAAFKPATETTDEALAAEAGAFESEVATNSALEAEANAFVPEAEPDVDKVFGEAVRDSVVSDVDPASPSQVVKEVNPELAQQMHRMAGESDEAAEALYGTNKTEALANDLLPSNGKEIKNKPIYGPETVEPDVVKAARTKFGNTVISANEMTKVLDNVAQTLRNVDGMVLHANSMALDVDDAGYMTVAARYSPESAGFLNATTALRNAAFAFREYGLEEDAFELLTRSAKGDWVVVPKEKALEDAAKGVINDYAVQMRFDYSFRPQDLEEVDLLTHGGWLARNAVKALNSSSDQWLVKQGQGSLLESLMDPSSIIHPQIVGAASVAVDKSHHLKAVYADLFTDFSKEYKALGNKKAGKEAKARLTDYIHQSNAEGIKFDVADLRARGFNSKEIEILKKWRRANDVMWYAANDDLAVSLRNKGYKVLVHAESDTKLFGKPVSVNSLTADSKIFNPKDKAVLSLGPDVRKAVEEGQLIKLTEPVEIDGEWVDFALSLETPEGGYLRNIAEGEKVLTYRDGYYPVMYDANYFMVKRVAPGKEKVIASARNTKEVEAFKRSVMEKEQLSEEAFNEKYYHRKDRRLEAKRQGEVFEEGTWSLASNNGLTTQRVRGQRLADAGDNMSNFGRNHLKDPLEAVTEQIQQLSQRVAMRNFLDAAKQRWIKSYGKYLELPEGRMPLELSGIKPKPNAPKELVAQARTNFNYLYSLENGYINGIDNSIKAGLHVLAEQVGKAGGSKLEEMLLDASRVSPTSAAKSVAFKLFISSSPARQALVQRTQMPLLMNINPSYASTSMVKDVIALDNARMKLRLGKDVNPKMQELLQEARDAGIFEAVEAHTLLRERQLQLADMTNTQKAIHAVGAPLRGAQKIGFDLAEQDVLLSAWLTYRDLAKKAGKDLKSKRVQDEIHADARQFMLNMNRSGELAYSQNTLGLFSQFLSYQHKALLQPFTNQFLTPLQRAQMLGTTTAVYGVEATAISGIYNAIWGDEEPSPERDVIEDGLLDMMLNGVLTHLSGEQQAVDWGDLAPTMAYGLGNSFLGMLNTDMGEVIAGAPSTSLLFGNNPRLLNMFKTGTRAFYPNQNYEDPEFATNYKDVVRSALDLFSGYSQAAKAKYALSTHKILSSSGAISAQDVTDIEAMMLAFGVSPKEVTQMREAKEVLYEDYDAGNNKDDIIKWYTDLKRQMARRGVSAQEMAFTMDVYSEAWRVFGEDRPKAMEILMKQIEKDSKNGDDYFINGMLNAMGVRSEEDWMRVVHKLPEGEVRDRLMESKKTMEGLDQWLNSGAK